MRIKANPRESEGEQEGEDLVGQAIDLRARGQTKGEAALTQAAAELMCCYAPMLEASSAASASGYSTVSKSSCLLFWLRQ